MVMVHGGLNRMASVVCLQHCRLPLLPADFISEMGQG